MVFFFPLGGVGVIFLKESAISGRKSEENSSKSFRKDKIFSNIKILMSPLKPAEGWVEERSVPLILETQFYLFKFGKLNGFQNSEIIYSQQTT